MCLDGARFAVQVQWQDGAGQRGLANVVSFKSDSSGMFWFFSSDNWEMLVKVLDGCATNNRFWVFADATTNVQFALSVTDSSTGATKVYSNPLGHPASPVTDTDAFATCSSGAGAWHPAPGVAPASLGPARSRAGGIDATTVAPDESSCVTDAATGCLDGGRFRVAVDWQDQQGQSGPGSLVPFGSDSSLLFYFFAADNWEMLVKILDGCAVNGHFWVFAAATTNVEYTLTVTDTFTGAVTRYTNPQGHVSDAITDTAAFAACAATGPAQVSFIAGGSQTLTSSGQVGQVVVTVVDANGIEVPGAAVSWSSSNPGLVQVTPTGPLTATVTALDTGPGSSTVAALYDGLSAQATVLLANLNPGTFTVTSDLILALTPTAITLLRNASTEQLQPGQVLVGVDGSGVLARVAAVALAPDQVMVQVSDAAITDAYAGYDVDATGAPIELFGQLRGGKGFSRFRRQDGRIGQASLLKNATCTSGYGPPVDVDLTTAEIDFAAHLVPHGSLHPRDPSNTFALYLDGSLDVTLQTPQITLGQVTGTVTCTLALPAIGPFELSAPPFLFSFQGEPSVGVELELTFSGPSFTLSGPVGRFHGTAQLGIAYSQTSGWSSIKQETYTAGITLPPPGPGLGSAAFIASAKAFGKLDFALDFALGVKYLPHFTLVDAKFASLEAYGYGDLELDDPVDPTDPKYLGPDWSVGVGFAADLEADLSDNALAAPLKRLGIVTSINLTLELFAYEWPLLESPQVMLATPGSFDLAQGGQLTLSATTDQVVNGSLEVDAMPSTACSFTQVSQGTLSAGSGGAAWTPDTGYIGASQVRVLLRSDDLSAVIPYASNSANALITKAGMYIFPDFTGCFEFKLGELYGYLNSSNNPYLPSIAYWATGGKAPYVWTVSGLPPGLYFTDMDTLKPPYPVAFIYQTPTQLGTFPISASVTDSTGNSVSFSPTLRVVPP